MKRAFIRFALTLRRGLKAVLDPIVGWLAVALLRGIRHLDRARTANASAWFMRRVGPWLPEHRTGRANLAAAFPDKSVADIDQILGGVWDNLGRVGIEFAYLDRMRVHPDDAAPDGSYDQRTLQHIKDILDAPQPTAFFAAHLANWEL